MARFLNSIWFLLFVAYLATNCMAWPSKDKDNMRPHFPFHPSGQQMTANGQVDCTATDCTLSCTSGAYGYSCTDGNVYCYCDD
jgi:hypothetical protein